MSDRAQGDGTQKPKWGALKWRGLTKGYNGKIRMALLALLWIFSATLSFTQLGFAGVGIAGDYSVYMVVLLLPITLSATLLGTKASTLTGLFTGAVALLHAQLLPLDYYEFTFVNVYSSVIAMTFVGFLLGIMFSKALGNDRPVWRKCLYAVLVCVIVSWLYSLGFLVNVFVSVLSYLLSVASSTGIGEVSDAIQGQAISMATRVGDLFAQSWVNAANMSVASCLSIAVVDRLGSPHKKRSVRFVTNMILGAVAFVAFCITSVLCFVGISTSELVRGEVVADDEMLYICNQLDAGKSRVDALTRILERLRDEEVDSSLMDELDVMLSQDSILEGYKPDQDGYVFIGSIDGDYVYLSDVELDTNEYGDRGSRMSNLLNADVMDAIRRSRETGHIEKTVYDHSYDDIIRQAKKTSFMGAETASDREDAIIDIGSTKSELMYVKVLHNEETGDDVVFMVSSDRVYQERPITMAAVTVAFGTLLGLVFLVTSAATDRLISRRLRATNDILSEIEEGNLDARANARNTVEFDELSNHINSTVDSLKHLIEAAKRQNEKDMATAKAIQESAIPRIFPPFPDNLHFDIYATMNAARDVGGDFYDFFLIGDDSDNESGRLAFVMADVSGKGIPAALFMMKAITQLRDYLSSEMEIGEAVANVNRQLCANNNAGMFVTAWVGILDYPTGHIDFVNAGHNPPMVWQQTTGEWSWLKEKSGLPLGLFDGMGYRAHSIDCLPGDQILLYTDGVTEAFSVDEEQFGDERLEDLLRGHCSEHPREICGLVRKAVAEHAEGAEQSDDITMLALEVGVPPEITATLTVPADLEELETVYEFIHTELDRRLCPLRVQNQIDIAVEELFANICNYAYGDGEGMVRVSYTYSAEPPSVIIALADEGVPYNPLEKPDAVTPSDIQDVPIGGLGILMAKRSVNSMEYVRDGDANVLTITKKW